jgi:hypothetical protein
MHEDRRKRALSEVIIIPARRCHTTRQHGTIFCKPSGSISGGLLMPQRQCTDPIAAERFPYHLGVTGSVRLRPKLFLRDIAPGMSVDDQPTPEA